MGSIFGNIKYLQSSDRAALEKLTTQRINPHDLLSTDLAKRAAKVCAKLNLQVGLLIGRDGKVCEVIVGSRERIYLPDLGRYRLSQGRLRRLRFIVFLPEGQHKIKQNSYQELPYGEYTGKRRNKKAAFTANPNKIIPSPELAADLITDLEKLRFDAVVGVAVLKDGTPSSLSMSYIKTERHADKADGFFKNTKLKSGVGFYHARDVNEIGFDFEEFISSLETEFTSRQETTHKNVSDAAVLVGAYTCSQSEAESSMAELVELARSADIKILDTVIQRRRELDPKTVIGKGKVEDLVLHCLELGADLLIFDRELSPGQLRSITNLTELRVLDRSMLILDIFSQRAKSSEGRLQVELAQLKYNLPRLTERDSGLSRLSGGIGGRGPGETKLEIGRRRARDRIVELEKRINNLASQRSIRRERRVSRGVPIVAIVGYTNAGKSTLLNALTKGNVIAEDKLFATLDPSSRRMRFPNDREVIFVDTVGFIRELPDELVSAFSATLEEVAFADVLIHVVDTSNLEMKNHVKVVNETLDSLGYTEKTRLLLLNKVDLLSPLEVLSLLNSFPGAIPVSATGRVGFEDLISQVHEELSKTFKGQDPGRFTEVVSSIE
jgi:GTPase